MTLSSTMMLLVLWTVSASFVLGADVKTKIEKKSSSENNDMIKGMESVVDIIHGFSYGQKRSVDEDAKWTRSTHGTIMETVEAIAKAVHDVDHAGGPERRDSDWDDDDVLDDDWGNGGWGNGDATLGSLSNWEDGEGMGIEGDSISNTEIWFPVDGDTEGVDNTANSDWWGV